MTRPARALTISSAGRPLRLETFFPPGVERAPALLLLHGASGMNGGHRYVPHFAGALAAHGFATVLVRYFDVTETTSADDAEIRRHFDRWLQAIDDAVTAVAQFPEVDPARLALVGYSLGGYLAVAQASRDRRLRAVVEFVGGIDREFAKSVTHLPPTLLVHGENDRRVPFHRAAELEAVLQRVGAPYETRYFPDEGHLLSPAATLVALTATVDFLQRHFT
ncbi:MAG TPA: prolyl oligopeptidase family serine peptidase [Chthoniobacteraceae bacterium]|jgi:dipeptidyl aminopeptidase/acylaminoacyl peptidase|nr:prolyl oligopeptidase family serine peptidase [Chthoniobacteraceae bacterium]